MRLVVRLSVLAALLATSCAPGLGNREEFEADGVCDFDVQRDLLVPRCARTGCHVPFEPQAGVEYLSGGLADRLVGVPAFTCPGHYIIDPVNPDQSFILERLSEEPDCDGEEIDRMPQNSAPLSEAELECVTRWVQSFEGRPIPVRADAGPRTDGGP